jgi:opacity protein-like surface antigen
MLFVVMDLRSTALFFAITTYANVVQAEEGNNYVSFSGGVGWASDIDRTMTAGSKQKTLSVEFDNTFGFSGAYGRQIVDWFRLEGELGYIYTKVDEVTEVGNTMMPESGDEQFFTAMVNGIVDIENTTAFTPFIGGGIGVVYAKHNVDFDPISTDTSPGIDSDESDTVFGSQLLAGVNWKYSDTVTFEAKYRLLYVSEREHSSSFQPSGEVSIDSTWLQSVMVGVRYTF